MFIAIYTAQKIQLNMQETGAGSLYKLYCSSTLFWEINHDNRPIVLYIRDGYHEPITNFFAENNVGARISNKLKLSPFFIEFWWGDIRNLKTVLNGAKFLFKALSDSCYRKEAAMSTSAKEKVTFVIKNTGIVPWGL